ncbi:SLATT domain-containing protein [Chromobacterium piscinae]|uniref:SLATT domain-containing protein n=1 Tax=Chromobacterium piscinae TaxID=686831 RepID=UPI001E2BF8EB|nr:SLATT domain-containing protein [Chromobacterium piscinae]MCD5328479.1 SLATT domain-containing protein [Chromobacterium piscinae]
MSTEGEIRVAKAKGVPLYAQQEYDKQLNYGLWSTSRTRFIAARRLKSKDSRSSKTISFLSAYMILFTLLDFLFLNKLNGYNSGYVIFFNISCSIMILIFSQFESSASYAVRSHKHHQCGLEISTLYKRLRKLKSQHMGERGEDFYRELEEIDKQYDLILIQNDNHEMIDYDLFKATYPKYEDHSLNWFDVFLIRIRHYIGNVAFYHFAMFVPAVLILGVFILVVFKSGIVSL